MMLKEGSFSEIIIATKKEGKMSPKREEAWRGVMICSPTDCAQGRNCCQHTFHLFTAS